MQTKEKLVSGLRSYAASMRELVTEANIRPSQIEIPIETERLSLTELEEGLDWLKGVFEKEFARCRQTKALLPEDQWNHYRQMDMTGTIEMKELKEVFRALRKVIINKNRPRIFRRTRAKQKQNPGETQKEESPQRSES